jgi:hypothetical protein
MIKSFTTITLSMTMLASPVLAEKGAEKLMSKESSKQGSRPAEAGTIVTPSNSTIFQSGMKSLGVIGKTGKYEVVSIKLRGLDTPNLTALMILEVETEDIVYLQTVGGAGMGAAIVQSGGFVAGSYLHQAKRGADTTTTSVNVSNGSNSGSTSSANSAASSDSSATSTPSGNVSVVTGNGNINGGGGGANR